MFIISHHLQVQILFLRAIFKKDNQVGQVLASVLSLKGSQNFQLELTEASSRAFLGEV